MRSQEKVDAGGVGALQGTRLTEQAEMNANTEHVSVGCTNVKLRALKNELSVVDLALERIVIEYSLRICCIWAPA